MFTTIARSTVAIAAVLPFLLTSAVAQRGANYTQAGILTVNQAEVIRESKAGKSVQEQMQTLKNQAEAFLESEVQDFNKTVEILEKQRDLLSESDFKKKVADANRKRQELPYLKEIKQRELGLAEQNALGKIADEMGPIIDKMLEEKKGTIILDASVIVVSRDEIDITSEVTRRVDRAISYVKVEPVDLRAEMQKLQQRREAAAAGAASGK